MNYQPPLSQDFSDDDTDSDWLLDFRNVVLARGGNTLVGPVTWQVELDERWVILGPNGAGKTSLMRMAATEEFPTSGQAFVMGEKMGRTDLRELRPMIGMSSSALANRIPGHEKVFDLVISAGYSVLGRWREDYDEMDARRAQSVIRSLGVWHLRDRQWQTLSEGERKRTLIARALMTDPELLLFDEPGAGLDLGGREDLVAHLSKLAADPDAPAMVLITHHVEEIPPGFTNAMLLRDGEVVAQGPIDEVLTSKNLSRTFGQAIELSKVADRYFARGVRRGSPVRFVR